MSGNNLERIECKDAPAAIGPYSQAIKAGGYIFVSGQLPIDPTSGTLIKNDISVQTDLVISNMEKILASCGVGLENVVKVDVFLSDIGDFSDMNEVYSSRFTSDIKPARCVIQAAGLPKDVDIEISCVAFTG